MSLLKKFVREEDGLELVEYAVMAALLVGAIVLAIGTLSTAISGRFTNTAAQIQ